MAKTDPKNDTPLDALVLGEHPAAYLAAALLRHKSKLRILHSCIPGEHAPDRLVVLNPEFFTLHKILEPLRRKMNLTAIYGAQFLADDPNTRSEHRHKSTLAYVAAYKDVRAACLKLAHDEGVEFMSPKTVQFHRIDETGLDVTLGKAHLHPSVLVLAGTLSDSQQRMLGLPEAWGPDLVHRYTFLKLRGAKWANMSGRPTLPMSLDLGGHLFWAWLLPHEGVVQLAVVQPVETLAKVKPHDLLMRWVDTLRKHGVMHQIKGEIPVDQAESMDLPLAGALAHEGLANRTLLVGPAGGFYSASGEDIYPNCWSALFAAEVIKKAINEPHLQDALNPYRQRWRTTLGDYLRGPQQNLRFLLPLVYRNQVMTTRLAEAILLGQSMVR